ncbi:MAG: ferritin-like domain-containing protein [Carboxydocellales bacterium]
MDRAQLILKLNWFYSLELSQVDLYQAQSKTFKNSYYGLSFERIAYVEQQHVDNLGSKIKELGGQPSKLGDVISPILGSVGGKLISLAGLENTLKANILLETKAMQDYRDIIYTVKQMEQRNDELLKILESNFIDEDLHTAWFAVIIDRL